MLPRKTSYQMRLFAALSLVLLLPNETFSKTGEIRTPWDWIGDTRVAFGSWFKDSLKKGRLQEENWKAFKNKYKRQFKSWSSESKHRDAWRENDKLIEDHNKRADQGIYTYYTAQNQFSDLSEKEMEQYLLKKARHKTEAIGPVVTTTIPPLTTANSSVQQTNLSNFIEQEESRSGNFSFLKPDLDSTGLPSIVDWREEGLVTRVRNQLKCNSCSAFAALGALEAQWAKKTGSLINLSAQQIVDCGGADAGGCIDGAWMDDIFKNILHNGGVDSEACYPYAGQVNRCEYMLECTVANLTSWKHVLQGNETALQEVVATVGPVAVAMAIDKTFPFYSTGIYNNGNCSADKKHALLIIGYGTENGIDYWLVKNSWGKTWGTRGYGKVIRNNNNQCLIATYAFYPTV